VQYHAYPYWNKHYVLTKNINKSFLCDFSMSVAGFTSVVAPFCTWHRRRQDQCIISFPYEGTCIMLPLIRGFRVSYSTTKDFLWNMSFSNIHILFETVMFSGGSENYWYAINFTVYAMALIKISVQLKLCMFHRRTEWSSLSLNMLCTHVNTFVCNLPVCTDDKVVWL